ncbi:MAG: outer membrane beta-barrel protein [Bacteroidota bacterium]
MKKKLLLPVAFLSLLSITTKAQIEKGQKILSGGISFNAGKNESDTVAEQKSFNVLFSPSIGKAIKNNLVVGIGLIAGGGNTRNESFANKNVEKSKQWTAGARVFLNKYFPLGKGFSFLGGVGTGYSHSDNKYERTGTSITTTIITTKSNEFQLGANVGLVYAFNKKWMANFNLNNLVNFGVGQQQIETKTGATSFTQKHKNIGVSSVLNYGNVLSNMAFGFMYIL